MFFLFWDHLHLNGSAASLDEDGIRDASENSIKFFMVYFVSVTEKFWKTSTT